MRTIKFRAWDKENKKMVKVDTLFLSTNEIDYKENLNEPKNIEHFELMQYTDLNDINGKEVFEGDIIQAEYLPDMVAPLENTISEVVYDSRDLTYIIKAKMRKCRITGLYNIIILGNIYENPELLSEGKS